MTTASRAVDPAPASRPDGGAGSSASPPPLGATAVARRGRLPGLRLVLAGLAALLLLTLVRSLLVQAFYVPSASMEPSLQAGDRVLVNRTIGAADLRRGDLVVVDGTDTLGQGEGLAAHQADGLIGRVIGGAADAVGMRMDEQDYLKRVIGLPGDRVRVDGQGRLSINGAVLEEPYLARGDAASSTPFDVRVPPGRIWLMGDNRPASLDSRALLGKPGGGMIALSDLVGRVDARYWPLQHAGRLAQHHLIAPPSTQEPR